MGFLRCSRLALMRLPKSKRPKARSWEFMNGLSFGLKEGSQNYRTSVGTTLIISLIVVYEFYLWWQRIKARGDTCAACEAARQAFKKKLTDKDRIGNVA